MRAGLRQGAQSSVYRTCNIKSGSQIIEQDSKLSSFEDAASYMKALNQRRGMQHQYLRLTGSSAVGMNAMVQLSIRAAGAGALQNKEAGENGSPEECAQGVNPCTSARGAAEKHLRCSLRSGHGHGHGMSISRLPNEPEAQLAHTFSDCLQRGSVSATNPLSSSHMSPL